MKYVVPISKAEHLFDVTELGLIRAKELAIASHSKVILEDGAYREIVFPMNQTVKISGKKIDSL